MKLVIVIACYLVVLAASQPEQHEEEQQQQLRRRLQGLRLRIEEADPPSKKQEQKSDLDRKDYLRRQDDRYDDRRDDRDDDYLRRITQRGKPAVLNLPRVYYPSRHDLGHEPPSVYYPSQNDREPHTLHIPSSNRDPPLHLLSSNQKRPSVYYPSPNSREHQTVQLLSSNQERPSVYYPSPNAHLLSPNTYLPVPTLHNQNDDRKQSLYQNYYRGLLREQDDDREDDDDDEE